MSGALRLGDTQGQVEILFRKIEQTVQFCAAARQHESRGNLPVEPGALQVIANQSEQFLGARLDDVRELARENCARRAVADAGDLDWMIFYQQRQSRAAVLAFDSFRFGNWRAQADREIVGEMIPSN